MCKKGHSYREVLGVSNGSLSLWLLSVTLSEEHQIALEERKVQARERTAETLRARRIARHGRIMKEAAAQIPELTESELFVAGVVAYWAEGTKSRPGQSERIVFVNSDHKVILLSCVS
jgi:hypothetical protein